jgi:hypothetical protein
MLKYEALYMQQDDVLTCAVTFRIMITRIIIGLYTFGSSMIIPYLAYALSRKKDEDKKDEKDLILFSVFPYIVLWYSRE